jgi:hypothetical protein
MGVAAVRLLIKITFLLRREVVTQLLLVLVVLGDSLQITTTPQMAGQVLLIPQQFLLAVALLVIKIPPLRIQDRVLVAEMAV